MNCSMYLRSLLSLRCNLHPQCLVALLNSFSPSCRSVDGLSLHSPLVCQWQCLSVQGLHVSIGCKYPPMRKCPSPRHTSVFWKASLHQAVVSLFAAFSFICPLYYYLIRPLLKFLIISIHVSFFHFHGSSLCMLLLVFRLFECHHF